MKITNRKVDDLIPYAMNSRTHSEDQVNQIISSINEFGWTNPVLIDEKGSIIAGHGRASAAKKMGMVEVPCITLEGLSEAQKKAYVIADNKLALNAGWDFEMLAVEMEALQEMDFDLSLTGFGEDELADIFDPVVDVNELQEETYSEIFNVIIQCDDETQQEKIYNELDAKGYKCQIQSL